ncbi:MAG: hypothetical protein ACRBB6_15000 [Neptuniibacter sp.]
MSIVCEQERIVALKSGLSELEYMRKREIYCRSKGTSWERLTALSEGDLKAIRLTGLNPDDYSATKLKQLAETVSRNFIG